MKRWAELSADGVYRYSLGREWDESADRVMWIMLNPSTADDEQDDPTIRRCIGFSRSWGFGGMVVVNLFAFRATEPAHVFQAKDPEGPENDTKIVEYVSVCDLHVAAWGERGAFGGRDTIVKGILNGCEVPRLWCVGKTNKDKAPRHPLYVKASKQPELYWVPERQQRFSELAKGALS